MARPRKPIMMADDPEVEDAAPAPVVEIDTPPEGPTVHLSGFVLVCKCGHSNVTVKAEGRNVYFLCWSCKHASYAG